MASVLSDPKFASSRTPRCGEFRVRHTSAAHLARLAFILVAPILAVAGLLGGFATAAAALIRGGVDDLDLVNAWK